MLSWVFRHRARLGLIYGIPPALQVVQGLLPAAPKPDAKPSEEARLPPGSWARRRHYVVLRPMLPNTG